MSGQRRATVSVPPERGPVPILYEVRWVSRKVLMVEENLAPNEIRSPERSVRNGRCTDYAVIDRISETTDSISLKG